MKKEYDWRTGRSCVYKLQYYLVFVTKYRKGVFRQEQLQRLEEVFAETCEQMEGELLEFSGESEHVHLLVSLPPKRAVSNVVGKLKGKSSYVLRREFGEELEEKLWGKHLWSPSYCVVSCGGAPLEVIKKYIEDQQRPPNKISVERSQRVTQQSKQKQSVAH